MKTGRPTDYSAEKLKIAKQYLQDCWGDDSIPYIEALAYKLDITRETVYQWSKDDENKKQFSYTVKRIEDLQRLRLLQRSNAKDAFTPGQIFQLKANHGMIETERKMLVGKEGESLGVIVLPEVNK